MFAIIYKVMKFHIHFALNIYLHFQPSLQGTISSRFMMCVQYKILSLKKQWNGMYFLSSSSSFLYTNFPSSVFLLATPPNYSYLPDLSKKRIVIFCLAFYLTNLPHSAWCTSLKFFSYAHYWLLYWLSRNVSLIKLLLILPRIYLNFLSAHEYIQFYHFMWLAKGLQYHPLKHWCNGTGNKDLMLVTTLHFLPATVLWAICYCL